LSAPEQLWSDPRPPAGHAGAIEGLWRALAAERLPHALLFCGPRGIGKFTAARWFVRGLFCVRRDESTPAGPCGTCPPCKRLAAGSHPDLFVIEPDLADSEVLLLDRFVPREKGGANAQEFLRLRPVEGGWRVVLVREMERTKAEAQNALLKMLEEPGENVLWILETSRPAALLPTIHSRCVNVELAPLDREDTREVLKRCGLPGADAAALARWSHGSPGQAQALHARGAIAVRELLRAVLVGASAAFGAEPAARRVWSLEGAFEGKTTRAVERDRARFVLDLALAVVRDWMGAEAGVPEDRLAHGDLTGELLRGGGGTRRSRRILDSLLEARRDVDLNVNPVSVLDLAFLALEGRGPGAPAASSARAVPTQAGGPR